jgi:hypothetical protein
MSAQRRQRVEGDDAATIMGIALIVIGHRAAAQGSGAWLRTWPVTEIELGLFTTGLFGYVGQRDVDEERLRRVSEVIAGRPGRSA